MSITEKRLIDIRARLATATEGPWAVDDDDPEYIVSPEKGGYDGLVIAKVVDQDEGLFPIEHNGQFIAHAPTDISALLAEIDRLRGECQRLANETKHPAWANITDDMVERAAEAWYVAQNPGREDWALSAWADMGGSEPCEERAAATLAARAALTTVLDGGDNASALPDEM